MPTSRSRLKEVFSPISARHRSTVMATSTRIMVMVVQISASMFRAVSVASKSTLFGAGGKTQRHKDTEAQKARSEPFYCAFVRQFSYAVATVLVKLPAERKCFQPHLGASS